MTSSPVNFVRRFRRANRNSRFSQRNTAVGGNKGATLGNPHLVQPRDHQNAFTSLAPLEPLTTVPRHIPLAETPTSLLDIMLDTTSNY